MWHIYKTVDRFDTELKTSPPRIRPSFWKWLKCTYYKKVMLIEIVYVCLHQKIRHSLTEQLSLSPHEIYNVLRLKTLSIFSYYWLFFFSFKTFLSNSVKSPHLAYAGIISFLRVLSTFAVFDIERCLFCHLVKFFAICYAIRRIILFSKIYRVQSHEAILRTELTKTVLRKKVSGCVWDTIKPASNAKVNSLAIFLSVLNKYSFASGVQV